MNNTFAAGLRQAYGRLPSAGIPRILRPRRKQGTTAGFTVVDVGGNWLRISRAGDPEDDAGNRDKGLARAMEVAARQGDSHGDDARALAVLDRGVASTPMLRRSNGRVPCSIGPSCSPGWDGATRPKLRFRQHRPA